MGRAEDDLLVQYRRLEHELDRMFAELAGGGRAPRAPGMRAMADVYQHAEIEWGRFERRLRVGAPVEVAAATADYDNGMLTITLPLSPRRGPETVRVSVRGDL